MEILPIIIIIIIVSVIRNAIEQARKKQQHTGQGKQGDQRRFPKFPDLNDIPGFPEERVPEAREGTSDVTGEPRETRTFIDEKKEKYRKGKEKVEEKVETSSRVNDLTEQRMQLRNWEKERDEKLSNITREMTSSRKELKKGIIWKEILDKPKFKTKQY